MQARSNQLRDAALGLELLGPVRAHAGGSGLALGGVKARGVLALLALEGPRAVQAHELARGVWGDEPPPSAVATLQAYVSRLRAALGPHAVLGGRSGYRFGLDPQVVDAHRFRELVAQARTASGAQHDRTAVELVASALAQWQGAALGDLRELPGLAAAAAALERERLAAEELMLSLQLRLGQHAAALPRLQELVDAHPLDEQLSQHLALALYRSGRQADALEVCTRLRTALVEELGVEPSAQSRALHQSVLAQDPALHGPSTAHGPGSLPVPTTSFVGRTRELEELLGLLGRDAVVSLAGPRGIGKTRLALELAVSARPRDGAFLVDLSAVVRAEQLLPAVTAALDVQEQPGVAPYATLVGALARRDVLLVLDGADGVLGAAARLLQDLRRDCAGFRGLSTAVDAPPSSRACQLAPLARDDALALLLDRADDGGTARHDPAALERLVEAAAGVPLDLELVGARLRTTSAARLAASLDAQDGAVMAWTLASLDADARRALSRLAVFPAGFDRAAATVVAAGDVDDLLPALARRSLLTAEPGGPTTRYRLPEAVRAALPSAPDEVRARHACACLELVDRAGGQLRGPAARGWFDRLDLERPSLAAALDHALASRSQDALRLVDGLGWYWFRRGRTTEGRRAVAAALAAADGPPAARAGAHLAGASLAYHAGDLPALEEHTREGLRDARAAADGTRTVRLLLLAAWHAALAAGLEQAQEHTAQALAAADGEPALECEALLTQGMLQRHRGELESAAATLARSRACGTVAGHTWGVGSAAWIAAKVAVDRGLPAQAHRLYAESLRLAVADGDVASALVNLHGIAGLLARTGNPSRGARLLGAVAAHGGRIGYDPVLMDPVDGPPAVAAVTDGLDGHALSAALAAGRQLSFPAAVVLGYSGLGPDEHRARPARAG